MHKRLANPRAGGSLYHKKPKLDIAVQKRSEINVGASTSSANNSRNTKIYPPIPDNVWDGEDDDDLAMISQMIENKIQTKEIFSKNTENFETLSITFENPIKSSTQIAPVPCFETEISLSTQTKSIEHEKAEEAELLNIFTQEKYKNINTDNLAKPVPTTKYSRNSNSNANGKNTDLFTNFDEENYSYQKYEKIRKLNVESTYNINEIENKEMNELLERINELNQKVQTKDGEISVLRHELKSSKQSIDLLRIEKLTENESLANILRQDYEKKFNELEKAKCTLEAELLQKKNEIFQLKQKKTFMENPLEIAHKCKNLSEIKKLNFTIHPHILCHGTNYFQIEKEIIYSSLNCDYFQRLLQEIAIVLRNWESLDFLNRNSLVAKIVECIISKINSFLEKTSNFVTQKLANYRLTTVHSDIVEISCINCVQNHSSNFNDSNEFSNVNKYENFRIISKMICFIVEEKPEFRNFIVTELLKFLFSDEKKLNIICLLMKHSLNTEFCNEILILFVSLLTSLTKVELLTEIHIEYFYKILKSIPGLKVMVKILNWLQIISKKQFVIEKLCKKSLKFKIIYTNNKKIIKIPKNGCFLQAFITILQHTISVQKTMLTESSDMCEILDNYCKFLWNCILCHPELMKTFSTGNNNSNKNDLCNSSEVNPNLCNCFTLLYFNFLYVFNQTLKNSKYYKKDQKYKHLLKTSIVITNDMLDVDNQAVSFYNKIFVKKNLYLILDFFQRSNQDYFSISYGPNLHHIKNSSLFCGVQSNDQSASERFKTYGKMITGKIFLKTNFF